LDFVSEFVIFLVFSPFSFSFSLTKITLALCWIVWHKMFIVRSTLTWAVLTCSTDWVCQIGTLTLCV